LLSVKNVSIAYGRLQAVWDATFDVQEEELVVIIGANGSGKSTILKTISGLIKPQSGTITFLGQRIDGLLPNRVTAAGIVHVPEGRRLFPEMTVLENLYLGAYCKVTRGVRNESIATVYHYFPVLEKMSSRLAGTLSGGEQQMLAIGRGLMAKPKLIMLDEPSLGLAPILVKGVFDIVQRINREGVSVLLVEQNVRSSLKLAKRGYVLESGRITMSGPGKELLENENIKKAYLAG
jgi:branched-chain amino acid transport system ATP-binding protein